MRLPYFSFSLCVFISLHFLPLLVIGCAFAPCKPWLCQTCLTLHLPCTNAAQPQGVTRVADWANRHKIKQQINKGHSTRELKPHHPVVLRCAHEEVEEEEEKIAIHTHTRAHEHTCTHCIAHTRTQNIRVKAHTGAFVTPQDNQFIG